MSLESLQKRLAALHESSAQLGELVARLARIAFPPGTAPAAIDEDGTPSSELSAEISALLRAAIEEHLLLVEEAKYLRPEGAPKAALQQGVAALGSELSRCRAALRRARLSAKQTLERAQRTERELAVQALAEPPPPPPPPPPTTTTTTTVPQPQATIAVHTGGQRRAGSGAMPDSQRQAVRASSSLTEALQRTHALMSAELARSEFAHEMLAESSAALARLDEEYGALDGMLRSSRELLGALVRSQKSDTWYLRTARWLLLATLAWLVFRRLLYGPLWWVVYLPLRVVWGLGSGAGRAVVAAGRGERHTALVGDRGGGAAQVEGLPDESLPTVRVAEEEAVDGTEKDDLGSDATGEVDGETETVRDAPRDEL